MSDMKIKVILEEANVNKDFFTSNRKENNLKCPFCQQELTVYEYSAFTNVGFLPCEKCKIEGTKEMWEALIHTRKALDVAVDALDAGRTLARIAGFEMLATGMDEAVNKITALEQKDK